MVSAEKNMAKSLPALLLLQATICILTTIAAPTSEQCDIDLRLYDSTSECLTGFSTRHEQLYSIIADGECHDSGTEDLGFYAATCDSGSNQFQLARSGCTDKTCSECTQKEIFSGVNQEDGCMIDWAISDLNKPGSEQFLAIADGKCRDSGIEGLRYYTATCYDDDGNWFQLPQSGCTSELCTECTGASESKISSVRGGPAECEVEAFYKEQVWSISGSCQRQGCNAAAVSIFPVKWWPSSLDINSIQCIRGNDYPEEYHLNAGLRDTLLFDNRDECCKAYARVRACDTTLSPTTSPVGQFINVTLNSSATVHRKSSLLGFLGVISLFYRMIIQ